MRTRTTLAAGLVLLAGLLTGCGGEEEAGDSPPADAGATEEEFCQAYAGLFENLGSMDPDDTGAGIRALQDWTDEMDQVGTPEDMPEDARRGFEVLLDTIDGIDPDATEQELAELGQDLSQSDQESGQSFVAYATETCPDAMKGVPGGPGGGPGEPSDEPS